jgi:hypothetical protein
MPRIANAHRLEHLQGALAGLSPGGVGVHQISLLDLLAHGDDRVQRVHGILHDHRDTVAADGAQGAFVGAQQIDAVELHAFGARASPGRQQAEDGPSGLRFSRAGFADDAELFAAELEAHAAHRVDDALGRTEAHVQIFDGQ